MATDTHLVSRGFGSLAQLRIASGRCNGWVETIGDRPLDIESRLVESVNSGELLDLAGTQPVDEQSMRSWDESHWVPASLIREILRGRLAPTPDPHGLRLHAARIVGRLDLENLTTSVCLELTDCFLPEGLIARDASVPGLTLERCLLEHPTEPTFWADRMRTVGNLVLTGTVVADTAAGAVRLVEAHIGNSLVCSGAKIRNKSGPAVKANGLQVGRAAFFRHGFEALGAGEDGTVGLAGADITSRLDFDGAKIQNKSGPAVRAIGLQVGRVASFSDGFEAVGAGEDGAMNMLRARIGSRLDCTGAKIRNESGPALTAESLQTGEDVLFRNGFEAVGAGEGPVVRLAGAHVGGALAFTADGVRNVSHPRALVSLDGLTYSGVPEGTSITQWLTLLRDGTRSYAAQPYQQLASVHRGAGHERDVRKILMEQRRHQIHSKALSGRAERVWAWLTGITLGYGYQPWRALIGLLTVLATAVILCLLSDNTGLAHTKDSTTPAAACSAVERVGVGLDLVMPLINAGSRTHCDLTATPAGERIAVTGWALWAAAWAFTTLFIAGFTGAVRKT